MPINTTTRLIFNLITVYIHIIIVPIPKGWEYGRLRHPNMWFLKVLQPNNFWTISSRCNHCGCKKWALTLRWGRDTQSFVLCRAHMSLTSVTQKNVPSEVVYYFCAWYLFLSDRRYKQFFTHAIKYHYPKGENISAIGTLLRISKALQPNNFWTISSACNPCGCKKMVTYFALGKRYSKFRCM